MGCSLYLELNLRHPRPTSSPSSHLAPIPSFKCSWPGPSYFKLQPTPVLCSTLLFSIVFITLEHIPSLDLMCLLSIIEELECVLPEGKDLLFSFLMYAKCLEYGVCTQQIFMGPVLNPGVANYGPWTKSSLLPVFGNPVCHLFMYRLWSLSCCNIRGE